MSRVLYTVNVDEYVCSELERIRTMQKTYDFSALSAAIERIQFHVSSMENALYDYREGINRISSYLEDVKDDAEFREKVAKVIEKRTKNVSRTNIIIEEDV